jgi:hypothetical protein
MALDRDCGVEPGQDASDDPRAVFGPTRQRPPFRTRSHAPHLQPVENPHRFAGSSTFVPRGGHSVENLRDWCGFSTFRTGGVGRPLAAPGGVKHEASDHVEPRRVLGLLAGVRAAVPLSQVGQQASREENLALVL